MSMMTVTTICVGLKETLSPWNIMINVRVVGAYLGWLHVENLGDAALHDQEVWVVDV